MFLLLWHINHGIFKGCVAGMANPRECIEWVKAIACKGSVIIIISIYMSILDFKACDLGQEGIISLLKQPIILQ